MALDIVQDAMLKLVERYGGRPIVELPLLFQRIVQNAIRDAYRRNRVRALWMTPIASLLGSEAEGDADPHDWLEAAAGAQQAERPPQQLERAQVAALIEKALERLPARQREAFLLRYWEELDVATVARIMGCSEGSVKTHCSRAVHALAIMLREQGLEP